MVLLASWADGTRFTVPRSSVSGVVVGKETGTPAVGAIVRLVGTPDTVKTDSAGHFRIETIPGKYTIEAIDTTLMAFVEPRSRSAPVEIRDGADAVARLELTPLERAVTDICRGQSMPPRSGLVVGFVAVKSGELPSDAIVEATFQHITDADFTTMTQKISLDAHGRFVVCGTPRDREIHLKLKTPSATIADTSVIVGYRESTHQVRWLVARP